MRSSMRGHMPISPEWGTNLDNADPGGNTGLLVIFVNSFTRGRHEEPPGTRV